MSKLIKHDGRLDIAAIKDRATAISNEVAAGITNPIQLLAEIEFVKKVCDQVRKNITDACMDDIYNHPSKKADIAGMEIHLRESGVKYDFSNTPHWVELNNAVLEATQARKDFESILLATKQEMAISDPDTGEMIEVFPPIRTSGESLFCTPKK